MSSITVALPLSVGSILILLSEFHSKSACLSSEDMFEWEGLDCLTVVATSLLRLAAFSSRSLHASLVAKRMSFTGNIFKVIAKLNPCFNSFSCWV